MKYSAIYVMSVVILNMAFSYVPPVELWDGTIWSVGSILAGVIFITRDFAQKEVGKTIVLFLMALSGLISYLMADPFVAFASVLAFSVSEFFDWAVYTFKKGGFKAKVILSSVVSVPVDTAIFLLVIDSMSYVSFMAMVFSKLSVLTYFSWRTDA